MNRRMSRIVEKIIFFNIDWVAHNYPSPRTTTSEWLHKVLDRNVSYHNTLITKLRSYYTITQLILVTVSTVLILNKLC